MKQEPTPGGAPPKGEGSHASVLAPGERPCSNPGSVPSSVYTGRRADPGVEDGLYRVFDSKDALISACRR